ncbi:hypothetical protein SCHPADRAFT_130756 [Schizopora paradoxa]|uniref:Uncharacterized protein n=1 Tax=Schizopora paradoxa TaxID=27342 RepID=A0A0H2S2R3_9AGAM|nr:hypothetical protein SCHPADRAFT_130756 [Schizopora paradoxa]
MLGYIGTPVAVAGLLLILKNTIIGTHGPTRLQDLTIVISPSPQTYREISSTPSRLLSANHGFMLNSAPKAL